MRDQGASPQADDEVPVAAFVSELGLPPAALARWMEHLEGFFARHGGAKRYGALAALTAETRAALDDDGPRGGG